MALFRPLDEISLGDTAEFGGKAARLGEAMRLGCSVLPGIALSSELYRRFMRQGGLQGEVSSILSTLQPQTMSQCQAAEWAIQSAFEVRRVPDEVVSIIYQAWEALGEELVAIRSSATSEDSPNQSFVGQHAAFLNVNSPEAAVDAVLGCWASLFSAQALSYARHFQVDLQSSAMAVLMQPMIDATSRGALFTVDPVIGDADVFVLEIETGPSTGVHVLDPYERSPGEEPTWSQLRHMGLLLDDHEGAYQSLEFMTVEGQVYLLRARPVTGTPRFLPVDYSGLPEGTDQLEWVHEPDVSPREACPLSWYHRSRSHALNTAYYSNRDILFGPIYERVDAYLCGYLYVAWRRSRMPIFEPAAPIQRLVLDTRRYAQARTLDRDYIALRDSGGSRLDEMNKQDLSVISGSELAGFLQQIAELHEAFWSQYGRLRQIANTFEQMLKDLHQRWLPDHDLDTDLLLWSEKDALTEGEEKLAQLASVDYPDEFAADRALDAFFQRYRHQFLRGDPLAIWCDLAELVPDSELAREAWAAWRQDDQDSPSRQRENRLEARDLLEKQILDRLGRVYTMIYHRTLHVARHYRSLHRDCQDFVLLCRVIETDIVRDVGRRIMARGLVETEINAALLNYRDIAEWLQGALPDDEIVGQLVRRQDQSSRCGRYAPPDSLSPEQETDQIAAEGNDEVMNGRPICAGKVVGRAHVIKSTSEATNVLPGEILVCEELLYELSPLYSVVAAVITERGSLLDHASVLAREYGVPTVFAVDQATNRIQTDDELFVDGTRGTVIRRVPEPDWSNWSI